MDRDLDGRAISKLGGGLAKYEFGQKFKSLQDMQSRTNALLKGGPLDTTESDVYKALKKFFGTSQGELGYKGIDATSKRKIGEMNEDQRSDFKNKIEEMLDPV